MAASAMAVRRAEVRGAGVAGMDASCRAISSTKIEGVVVAYAVMVGAGIGGLAATLALHQTGWDVTVLERAPELAPVGAGLTLWPNAMRALDWIGVGDAVRERSLPVGSN